MNPINSMNQENIPMSDLEAIDKRRSRRKYTGKPLSQKIIDELTAEITKFNHDSGLSMFFLEDGSRAFEGIRKSYGLLKGVRSLIVLKGDTSDVHMKEKCGYYGERLVLDATKLGLGTCWVAGSYDKKDPAFKCEAGQEVVSVIAIGQVEANNSAGENFIYKLTHRKSKPISDFYSLHHFDGPAPDWFMKGIEAVAKAPSAANSQPVHLVYDKATDKITAHVSGKRATDLIDLGIAKLHFEIATESATESATGGTFSLGNGGAFFMVK